MRWRQAQADFFAGNRYIIRGNAFEVHAGLHDAVREQQHAVFAVPFRVLKDDDFSSTYLTVTKSESVWTCLTTVTVLFSELKLELELQAE